MPNRNPNRIRARDERGHPLIRDAIGRGYEASGDDYPVGPFPGHDIANESRLVIGRALEHFGYPRAARVVDRDGQPCHGDCADPAAPHSVTFRLFAKHAARAHTLRETGGDPANLKYNPFRRGFSAE